MEKEDIIVSGGSSPYYTNKGVKKRIDEALEKCAILHTKTGTGQLLDEHGKKIDDRGSDYAQRWVREQENRILSEVEDLDPEFVDGLLYDTDQIDTTE